MEVVYQKHKLMLRIQKEVIDRKEEIANSTDIGWTSWNIAENIVRSLEEERKKDPFKIFLDNVTKVK